MSLKRPPTTPARILVTLLVAITALISIPLVLRAVAPSWWTGKKVYHFAEPNVVADPSDYSVANQGQLKNMAVGAYEHLLDIPSGLGTLGTDPGGIGSIVPPNPADPTDKGSIGWQLMQSVSRWVVVDYDPATGAGTRRPLRMFIDTDGNPVLDGNGQPQYTPYDTGARKLAPAAATHDDYTAINQGSLKAVAKPFYQRLTQVYAPFPVAKPWTDDDNPTTPEDTEDDESRAVANLGQLKNVFSFDIRRDSDGDGKSDLAELRRRGPGGVILPPTNPYNADSDGDGLSDGDETDSDPLVADTDGDGFNDGEDRWPADGRRGDYIPPKFYAVTDLTEYIPETLRTNFVGTHVTIDDNHSVGFAGKVDTVVEDVVVSTMIHTFGWANGAITTQDSFDNHPREDVIGGYYDSMFLNPYDPTSAWINSLGQISGNAYHDYAGDHGFSWPFSYLDVHRNPQSFWPDPLNKTQSLVAVSPAGRKLEHFTEQVDEDDDGSYEYQRDGWMLDGSEIESLTTIFDYDPFMPPPHTFNCRAVNDAGMFLVEKVIRATDDDPEITVHYYYDPNSVPAGLHSAVKGLIAINAQAQGIGMDDRLDEDMDDDYEAFFWQANTPSSGAEIKMDLEKLLKWDNKPAGAKDDYQRYFARSESAASASATEPPGPQIRRMRPKFLTDADTGSAGITVGGQQFSLGLPAVINSECEMLAASDAYGTSEDFSNSTLIWACETGDTTNDSHYRVHTILCAPGVSFAANAPNKSGTFAGTITTGGATPRVAPAIAAPPGFHVDRVTGYFDIDRGFDPPHVADKGEKASSDHPEDDDLQNWIWSTSVWQKRSNYSEASDSRIRNQRIVVEFDDLAERNRYQLVMRDAAPPENVIESFETEDIGYGGIPKRYRVRLKIASKQPVDNLKAKQQKSADVLVVEKHPSLASAVKIIPENFAISWMKSTPRLRVWVLPSPKYSIPVKMFFVRLNAASDIIKKGKFIADEVEIQLNQRFFQAGLLFDLPNDIPTVDVDYDVHRRDGKFDIDSTGDAEGNVLKAHDQLGSDDDPNRFVPIYLVRAFTKASVKGATRARSDVAINSSYWESDAQEAWANTDDEVTRANSRRERIIAHEVGHYFDASTRNLPNYNHDEYCTIPWIQIRVHPNAHYFGALPLMKAFQTCGTWMRWEDWLKVNKTAVELFDSRFDL